MEAPNVWNAVTAVMSVVAFVVSAFSAYWAWRSYVFAPRRDVLRRYVANHWRVSKHAVENGVDKSEFLTAVNEARVVFGDNKKVVKHLAELTSSNQARVHNELALAMAEASGFNTKSWPRGFLDGSIIG